MWTGLSKRGRAIAVVAVAGSAFKIGNGVADAANSYEGSDVSVGLDRNWLKVCDKESDGHQVHNDITWSQGGQTNNFLTDTNGNNNNCPETNHLSGTPFNTHRVVEAIPVWPDQFGPWVTAA